MEIVIVQYFGLVDGKVNLINWAYRINDEFFDINDFNNEMNKIFNNELVFKHMIIAQHEPVTVYNVFIG